MNHALVTIAAPLDPKSLVAAQAAIDLLGNPAIPALAQKLGELQGDKGIHFASLHAIPSFTTGKAHLLLEFSSDGDEASAIDWLASAIGTELAGVYAFASDWTGAPIKQYLATHTFKTGSGLGADPGLGHDGSPGMSVGRIKAEAELYGQIASLLANQGGNISALNRLDMVRQSIGGNNSEMLKPAEAALPWKASSAFEAGLAAAAGFVRSYLWPWLLGFGLVWLALVAWFVVQTVERHQVVERVRGILPPNQQLWFWQLHGHNGVATTTYLLGLVAGMTIKLLLVAVVILVIVAAGLYAKLRNLEENDWTSDRSPDPATLEAIFAVESQTGYAQNHMISLTERKSGWLRYFTSRLVFFVIASIGPLLYRPGYLGSIGTIHFARWITVPGTRDLVFLSNYGGSWESYLEDFITLAHDGLTGVWSNTVGFPKTTNLIGDGATDGERFKRYARQSMLPTHFWYSAYPELTTDMIRANADIRRGLSGAMTEDDAALWLARFGSALRPDVKLVTSEIQSVVFGGLGFLPAATATFWRLPPVQADARAWLAEVARHVAWSDGRRLVSGTYDKDTNAIVQLGLSAKGLAALGLPPEAVTTFPFAFQNGMDRRARILGDTGDDASPYWWWSESGDAAVLIYGETGAARDQLRTQMDLLATTHGAKLVHKIALRDLPASQIKPPQAASLASGNAKHAPLEHDPEPFGFADGISQPLIAGTYKAERSEAHPLHIVAPGEFVLGYPDNRGNLPPSPTLSAIHDPANVLPVQHADPSFTVNDVNQPRDLGRNGTFLVVRQLEQDVDAFKAFCASEAARLDAKNRLKPPYDITPEFIGAKMLGRWQNGTPLVRSPYNESQAQAIIEENAFLLGLEDPEALRCPFGAHIRRANPRDSLSPGSTDQVEISNRHRIMRVGRKYKASAGQKPGILFMCLNGDIERQFEFVQQTWLNGNVISLSCPSNLSGERDPIQSDGEVNSGFTIPSRDGPVKLAALPRFVTMRGGGYFFMPGKRLVNYLSKG